MIFLHVNDIFILTVPSQMFCTTQLTGILLIIFHKCLGFVRFYS